MCASGKPKETAMSHGKGKRKCSGTARGSSLVMTLIRQVWFLLSFILYITYDYLIICYTHLNHHVSLCFYSFLFKLRINFWWMQPPVGKKAWANLMSCNDSGLVSLKSIHTHTNSTSFHSDYGSQKKKKKNNLKEITRVLDPQMMIINKEIVTYIVAPPLISEFHLERSYERWNHEKIQREQRIPRTIT